MVVWYRSFYPYLPGFLHWHWWSYLYHMGTHSIDRSCRNNPASVPHVMTSSNGSIFRVTGPLCGEFTVPLNSPRKGQWSGALMFCLICALTNCWVNNWNAGDLGRHRVYYDVTVMKDLSNVIYTDYLSLLFYFAHYFDCKIDIVMNSTFYIIIISTWYKIHLCPFSLMKSHVLITSFPFSFMHYYQNNHLIIY